MKCVHHLQVDLKMVICLPQTVTTDSCPGDAPIFSYKSFILISSLLYCIKSPSEQLLLLCELFDKNLHISDLSLININAKLAGMMT